MVPRCHTSHLISLVGLSNNVNVTSMLDDADSASIFLSFHHSGSFLGFFLKHRDSLYPIHPTEVTHLIGAIIASIALFSFTGSSTVQVPFALLAIFCSVPADLTTIPALSVKCTVAFYRRVMYLLLITAPFILALGESLDLRHIVTQPVKIRAA